MHPAHIQTNKVIKFTPRKSPAARMSKRKVPRPRNTWLVYRSEKSKQIHESRPGMSAGAICKLTLTKCLLELQKSISSNTDFKI